MVEAFLSCSAEDAEIIAEVKNALTRKGIIPYLATEDTKPGRLVFKKIEEAIERADVFVVILSENSIRSKWVAMEIGYAKGKVPIVPIRVGHVNPAALLEGVDCINYTDQNLDKLDSQIAEAIDSFNNHQDSALSTESEEICEKGPHEIEAGGYVELPLSVTKGTLILGRLEEEDGDLFDWYIVNEKNLVKFKNREEFNLIAGGFDVAADQIRWVPKSNGPYFLIISAFRKRYNRIVNVSLRIKKRGWLS